MAVKPLISILIVDDHFVVRSGLAASLELEHDFQVVGEADRGEDAVAEYTAHRPSIVLMDLQLPDMDGVAATRALRAHDPAARVLMFSTFARDDEIQAALDAGALGYLQKSTSRSELIQAVKRIARGGRWIAPEVSVRLRVLRLAPAITLREREILAMIATGHGNKSIAGALQISEDTVKRHVSHILDKLDVNDRAEATVVAIRRGILKV